MLTLTPGVRIFLYGGPTDMRKSFDGLCAIVREAFGQEPTGGGLFLFVNRRRDRIKILWWDRDGLALFYKRLEAGTFEQLAGPGDTLEIDAADLAMLLSGVTLASAKRRKRYRAA